MKIILYRDGQAGVVVSLPGEHPEAELEELLGGETEMRPINSRLSLVGRREQTGGPGYILERLGQCPLEAEGDAAVIAVRPDGMITDITVKDLRIMEGRLRWTS